MCQSWFHDLGGLSSIFWKFPKIMDNRWFGNPAGLHIQPWFCYGNGKRVQKKSNSSLWALSHKNLLFSVETNIDDIFEFTDSQHFLTASIRKWSISNILREINSPSDIKHQSSMNPWQDLTSFWSNSWSEVKKTHSHRNLECVLNNGFTAGR